MHALEELKNTLHDELDEIARKPEMNAGDLETVHKLTDTIKNIDKIMMYECDDDMYSGRGYSRDGDWEARGSYARNMGGRGSYNRGNSYGHYEDGRSYANRRGTHYVRGHYSRGSATEHMIDELHELMGDASTEKERRAIDTCIRKLQDD